MLLEEGVCYDQCIFSRPGVVPEARGGGRKKQPHARGQGQRPGRATPCPRSGGVRAQEGLEEPSHVEGQEGQWEEIPLIQGKFAGAAVNRYPTSKVREIQVRW